MRYTLNNFDYQTKIKLDLQSNCANLYASNIDGLYSPLLYLGSDGKLHLRADIDHRLTFPLDSKGRLLVEGYTPNEKIQPAKPKWIRVKDELPTKAPYLVKKQCLIIPKVYAMLCSLEEFEKDHITHWTPIPELPEGLA